MDKIMEEASRKIQKAVEVTAQEFGSIRTGRATPALVERLQVEYYGTLTPLNQVATISAPEARLLVIHPYDRNSISDVEKAITQSDLGFVPSNDGEVIRVPVPQLTEERRRELTKIVKARAEEGRVAIRNVRREAIEALRKEEKKGGATEDDLHRGIDEIQRITDRYIQEIDELAHTKTSELMEI
ncbi:MAG: ribosome recycling factor [Actinobacteria bacterium]|nr:ribosome recycling factor [Actinomycetota bacterium]MCG2818732.1 ribosome recycling factor [Actinomycetes bacterium]MBU4178618.1 ribosome recycling factor [Actinomycetota bacterium]MBU4218628.1 ribosome recycling factor [Actinomycetota bacterium]MBU4359892.1 ribosome recycling factor [Actinomycetota bacterium]